MIGTIYLFLVAAVVLFLGFRELWHNIRLFGDAVAVQGTVVGFETKMVRHRERFCAVITYRNHLGEQRQFLGRLRSDRDMGLMGKAVPVRYLADKEEKSVRHWNGMTVAIAPVLLLLFGGIVAAIGISRLV